MAVHQLQYPPLTLQPHTSFCFSFPFVDTHKRHVVMYSHSLTHFFNQNVLVTIRESNRSQWMQHCIERALPLAPWVRLRPIQSDQHNNSSSGVPGGGTSGSYARSLPSLGTSLNQNDRRASVDWVVFLHLVSLGQKQVLPLIFLFVCLFLFLSSSFSVYHFLSFSSLFAFLIDT